MEKNLSKVCKDSSKTAVKDNIAELFTLTLEKSPSID